MIERYHHIPMACPVCHFMCVVDWKRFADIIFSGENFLFFCSQECADIWREYEPEWMN